MAVISFGHGTEGMKYCMFEAIRGLLKMQWTSIVCIRILTSTSYSLWLMAASSWMCSFSSSLVVASLSSVWKWRWAGVGSDPRWTSLRLRRCSHCHSSLKSTKQLFKFLAIFFKVLESGLTLETNGFRELRGDPCRVSLQPSHYHSVL